MRSSTPSLQTCLYVCVLTERSQTASMRHLSPYGTPFGNSYLQFTWMSPFAGRIGQFNCCSAATQVLKCRAVSIFARLSQIIRKTVTGSIFSTSLITVLLLILCFYCSVFYVLSLLAMCTTASFFMFF